MKCPVHPENDIIGTCGYCGRGVCPDCKESHDDIIHCKQCVAQGRIVDRPSLDWQAFFYFLPQPGVPQSKLKATMSEVATPYPTEEPEARSFRIGRYGAVFAGLMALVTGISSLYVTDMLIMLALNALLLIATVPFLMGLYGFNRNYGAKIAMAPVLGLSMILMLVLLINIYDNINVISKANVSYLTFTVGYSLLGIGYLLVGIALLKVKGYFVQGIMLRNFMSWISLTIMVGSILLIFSALILPLIIEIEVLLLTGLYVLGWFIISMSILGMYLVFMSAPLPERVVDRISDDAIQEVVAPSV